MKQLSQFKVKAYALLIIISIGLCTSVYNLYQTKPISTKGKQ